MPLDDTLLRRAAERLPRYTSYPTAPFFSAAVNEGHYRQWLATLDTQASLSLYLHLPYCDALCWYCGCNTKVAKNEAIVAHYAEALRREIEMIAAILPARFRVTHIHWGGGTPTVAGAAPIAAVMETVRRHFALAGDAEIAIEIDPRTLDREIAQGLGALGFTRASFGVQTFDPVVQRAINRIQSAETTAEAAEALRRAGIADLNLDLLYGLPHQTVESCVATVEQSLALDASRYAVFGYAHVPQMKAHQRNIDERVLPDAPARWAQADAMAASLSEAGYQPVGLDHFARGEDPLAQALAKGTLRRNFQGYTTDGAELLIGLGASSIGKLPQGYVQNTAQVATYLDEIEAGRLPIKRGLALSDDDRFRAAIIERLMCDLAVDLDRISAAYGRRSDALVAERAALQVLAREGMIEFDGKLVTVHDKARALVRQVAAVFDAYSVRSATHAPAV